MSECPYKEQCITKEMYGFTCSNENECGLKKILDKCDKKMNFLVTGSNGLIGRSIVKKLREVGHKVNEFDRGDNLPLVKVDMIIHCAANCVIRDVIENPLLAKENINITTDVLEYARKFSIDKIVVLSSSRVIHINNYNPYIASKIFSEQLTMAYNKCYGINYVIIRPETVWGVDESDVRVIRRWIQNAKNSTPITIYGNKFKELSPIYIDDFTDCLYNVIKEFNAHKNSKPFVISGLVRNVHDIIYDIQNVFGKCDVIIKPAEKEQPQKTICLENDIRVNNNFKKDLLRFKNAK